ncbi:GGDEF domain-containing protein [Hyphomonas sp. BRH_c22]|uniref:GGDEF domain-containing protein n=1 Tax=Hyphomonas sp. BRH_c22 TaxID=1629710 RepID=UPI000AB0A4B7|nr:GGDEF domain-containing protein [Hyphomonas sp. BRH_c22]
MQAALRKNETPRRQNRASLDFVEVYKNAGKAFGLIERYRTPPFPGTYALWYAYVSGTDCELISRIDDFLAKNGGLNPYDIEQLCLSLEAQGGQDIDTKNVGQAVEQELEGILKVIASGAERSDSFRNALSDVQKSLPGSKTSEDLDAIVSKLVQENQRMADATRQMNDSLVASQSQIQTLNQELASARIQSLRDPLTSLWNRGAFDRRIMEEVQEAEASGQQLCLAMADIDEFKMVNDTYGHQHGDEVLRRFASLIGDNIKGQDMVARYGGEEFAIIFPKTSVLSAYNLLVKIKHQFEELKIPVDGCDGTFTTVTASFGVARFEMGMTVRDLINQADTYLFEAKKAGRNRVKAIGFA